MKNKVLIIAAFPAMGKTCFTEHNSRYTKQILDSDSSLFSWSYNRKGDKILNGTFKYLDDDRGGSSVNGFRRGTQV